MLRGKEIKSVFDERYNQSWEKLQIFNEIATNDLEFYLGKQYSPQEEKYLADNDRESVINNQLLRAVNLLSGEQRLNRMGSAILAQNDFIPEESETANQLSEAIQFVFQKQNGYHHISQCFHGALVTAINFSEVYFDYSDDFSDGTIKFIRNPYNSIMWDPYFQNMDLSDCNHIIRRKYVSHVTAMGLLPDRARDIKKIKAAKRDGKFPTIPFEHNPNGQNLLAYDEFYERDTRLTNYIINMSTNDKIEVERGTKKDVIKEKIANLNKQLGGNMFKLISKYKSIVNLYVIIEGETYYAGEEPNGIDDYPFTPFIAFHTPEFSEFDFNMQSFIRVGKDPQRELNKNISKIQDMINRRIYGGHYAKLSKLMDPDDLTNSGNHGNIGLKDDAVIGADIAPIQYPDVPPSIFQLSTFFNENIKSSMNLNDAAFGTPQKGDVSGFLTQLQQSSAMVGLQPLYDNLNLSQAILTKKVALMIQNWSDKKIERITGKKPSPLFRDKDFSKWDIVCTQIALTEHQRKLSFMQLVELRRMGIEDITGTMLLKRAPLQDSFEIMKEVKANEEARAQQQQQVAQLQAQKEALTAELIQSQIRENEADTVRATGRAIADISLSEAHRAESIQKRANAALDLTKAANEIQDIRSNRFRSAVEFVSELQEKYNIENQEGLLLDKAIVDDSLSKLKTPRPAEAQTLEV